jgi:oligopeptide transport system permease protein
VSAAATPRGGPIDAAAFERALAEIEALPGRGPWREAWRRFRSVRSVRVALALLAAIAALALLAPLLPLRAPDALDLARASRPPCWPWQEFGDNGFRPEPGARARLDAALQRARVAALGSWQAGSWLGTDSKGRDLLARLVWGARTSLAVALAAAATSLVIGVLWGAVSGLAGGKVDAVLMRTVDALQSLPTIFLVVFLLAFVRASRGAGGLDRGQVFFLAIGAVSWLSMARVVRGQVLALRRAEFVLAARAFGASSARVLAVHVLPHVLPVAVVYLTLTIPTVVLYEAFLSFLGLGVEPPAVSFGVLAAEGLEAINPLTVPWWLVLWPAALMGVTLLALALVGDGLRDALDPRAKEPGA